MAPLQYSEAEMATELDKSAQYLPCHVKFISFFLLETVEFKKTTHMFKQLGTLYS